MVIDVNHAAFFGNSSTLHSNSSMSYLRVEHQVHGFVRHPKAVHRGGVEMVMSSLDVTCSAKIKQMMDHGHISLHAKKIYYIGNSEKK